VNKGRTSPAVIDRFKSLQILDELAKNDSLTQRDLSKRLGIALGLVNSYIKNLVAKGYLTVKSIPPKRYTYYLTPQGFTEKSRLTYHLLQDYTRIYREAKNGFRVLFRKMSEEGVRRVVFAGSDEVAEIAYITLKETSITLAGVVDLDKEGAVFFDQPVRALSSLDTMKYDCIIVASYVAKDRIYEALINSGIGKKSIRIIF
jgi:DNA-binding MarR family transcriptional regulator